ncbi:MAG: aldo/keto reductase [Nakamurella sp.]
MGRIPTITFSTGATMPQLGFGVWQVADDEAEAVVAEALKVGYRSIDTAQMYRNESGVGRALAASDVDRADVFLTTKLDNDAHGYDEAQRAFDESLKRLHTDYVDLFLIHWPLPAADRYVETWRALNEIRRSGRAKSIGVSNFTAEHLQRLIDDTGVAPVIDQIELHPYFQQRDMRSFNSQHGIATEAWSPLGQGGDVLTDPVIVGIAARLDVSPAQVVIAWHLAIGNVVIPKSVTPSRIAENFAAADVSLTAADLAAIEALDRATGRIGPDPDSVGGPS